jgi:hypothetical protein
MGLGHSSSLRLAVILENRHNGLQRQKIHNDQQH